MRKLILSVLVLCVVFSGCNKDLLNEFPTEYAGDLTEVEELRLVTYNIHGGKGPNGEGDLRSNLQQFIGMLQGESIICLQEVQPDEWDEVKSLFSDFPYRYYLYQCSTKFATHKKDGNAILSKLPILSHEQKLIQTDPGGDKWERKAQYVKLYIGNDKGYLHLFHFHNTYNWHNDGSASEKAGFEKFMNWARSFQVPENEAMVVLGDMNLSRTDCETYLMSRELPSRSSNWVDHIFSDLPLLNSGFYGTEQEVLSDHNAVWADLCNKDC
ncbi:MAG: hypothetical protein GC178_14355 [Flavobacteriales bacterium]|nr:hypothetical protein [Flavobacteriales bacterium]